MVSYSSLKYDSGKHERKKVGFQINDPPKAQSLIHAKQEITHGDELLPSLGNNFPRNKFSLSQWF